MREKREQRRPCDSQGAVPVVAAWRWYATGDKGGRVKGGLGFASGAQQGTSSTGTAAEEAVAAATARILHHHRHPHPYPDSRAHPPLLTTTIPVLLLVCQTWRANSFDKPLLPHALSVS